jgi:hypothetical protein
MDGRVKFTHDNEGAGGSFRLSTLPVEPDSHGLDLGIHLQGMAPAPAWIAGSSTATTRESSEWIGD